MRFLVASIAMLLLTGSTCAKMLRGYGVVLKDTAPLDVGRYARTITVEWIPPTEAVYEIEDRGVVYTRHLAVRASALASNGLVFSLGSEAKSGDQLSHPVAELAATFTQSAIEITPVQCELHLRCTKSFRVELEVTKVAQSEETIPGVTFELMVDSELAYSMTPWEYP